MSEGFESAVRATEVLSKARREAAVSEAWLRKSNRDTALGKAES